jgi:hypothetical protein
MVVCATLCACYGQDPRSRPMRPAPGVSVAQTSAPEPEATFDARLVDPRFEQAIADYWRDLRTLRWDANDNEIRRSLRLLAIAAERVPYTGSVDLATAAARVRGGRAHQAAARGAPTPAVPAPPGETVEGPLQDMARAFVALGRGPYREGVGVLGAAYAFEQAVQAMVAARARGGDRRASFEALGRGEQMLFAIRGAIGRGEVGLSTSAPPPVDFGP